MTKTLQGVAELAEIHGEIFGGRRVFGGDKTPLRSASSASPCRGITSGKQFIL